MHAGLSDSMTGTPGSRSGPPSDFFPPPPPSKPTPDRRPPVWWGPPEDELGREVPSRIILGHSDTAVVAIVGFVIYSTGFTFRVLTLLREHLGIRRIFPSFDAIDPDPFLKLDVEWPTGVTISTLDKTPAFNSQPEPPVLIQRSGQISSMESRFYHGWWMWPLPPPGSLRVLCEWPQEGIARTQHELDSRPLLEASGPS